MKTNRKIISHKKKLSRRKDKGSDVRKKYNSRLKKNITRKSNVLKGGAKNPFAPLSIPSPSSNTENTENTENNNTNPTNTGELFIVVDRRKITSLDSSPNYISFKIGSRESGFQEIGFKIDEMSVDKLQYFLSKKLLTISDNKIKINDKLFIMDTRKKAYSKSGYNLIDVYEDNTVDMLPYNTSLDNFFDINDTTNIYISKTNAKLSYNQDIDWLRKIIFDFNDISKENNPDKKSNLDRFLEEIFKKKTKLERPIFTKCDLNIVDQTKIIAEKIIIDGEVFVICGYPHMSMRSHLKLYEDSSNNELFKSIYSEHTKMIAYIKTLFNFLNPTNKIDTPEQIYKFYEKNNMHLKYLITYYKQIKDKFLKDYKQPLFSTNTEKQPETNNEPEIKTYLEHKFQEEYNIPYIENFEDEVNKLQNDYYNEIAQTYLTKPIMYIKYVFIVVKEHDNKSYYKNKSNHYEKNNSELPNIEESEKIYVPAIFNFRELTHKHLQLLQKMNELINTKLPHLYGITNLGEEYNLFYSTYKYGNVFNIQTEYLHTLSNIFQSSYKYKINITLEEIIYMLSMKDSKLQTLRVDYKIKENLINYLSKSKKELVTLKTVSVSKRKYTSSIVKSPCNYTKPLNETDIDLTLNEEFTSSNDIKILFMFKETGTIYTFIYLNKDKVCIIQFASNLCILKDAFETKLKTIYDSGIIDPTNFLYECRNIRQYSLNLQKFEFELFNIIKHKILSTEEYNSYSAHNPILKKNIELLNKIKNTMCLNLFIPNKSCILIPNIYKTKPILLRNYLGTQTYKDAFKEFKLNFKSNKSYSTVLFNKQNLSYMKRVYEIVEDITIEEKDKTIEQKGMINRIYFNLNNCGYNFIEIYEKLYENTYKYVIWVVPLNATEEENINDDFKEFDGFNTINCPYIGNFMDLNEKHINMLIEIKKLYLNNKDIFKNNSECVLNITTVSPTYHCIHFHIYENKEYKSGFIKNEIGSRISGDLTINKVLNNINWKSDYYNSINISIFKV